MKECRRHEVRWFEDPHAAVRAPGSPWVGICVQLGCDCAIESVRTFADEMRAQHGWTIATSVGWGRSGTDEGWTYSFTALRRSLGGRSHL